MHTELADESALGLHTLHASDHLSIRALPMGCIYSIESRAILINQLLASPVAGGIHRIYLRIHGNEGIRFAEIVGPGAGSAFFAASERLVWSGTWEGLNYRCTCWLHPSGGAWFFHVEIENRSGKFLRCDAVMVQDIGLATRGQVRNNEIFTSQYVDHSAIQHPEVGYLLMSRQNLPQPNETHPWLLQGCFPAARGFTTDGFDFFGVGYKQSAVPGALSQPNIGQRVRQYEAAYTAIQSSEIELAASASHAWTFFAHYLADHPEPSSERDVDRLQNVHAMHEEMIRALSNSRELIPSSLQRSVFQTCELYRADDLNEKDLARLFPADRRHEESLDGRLRSFFYGGDSQHVVLKAKELEVARPHGHIMRSGEGFTPDAELMSCAHYAAGVFASQLALGNSGLGKLLSAVRDRLNLVPSSGLRIFVRQDSSGPWQLLAVPSAFEMGLDHCRWYYKRAQSLVTVSCLASQQDPAFTFEVQVEGQPLELLICGEIAAGAAEYESSPRLVIDDVTKRITIRPDAQSLLGRKHSQIVFHMVTPARDAVEAIGGDELLFADKHSRALPYVTILTRATTSFTFTILGTRQDSDRAARLCATYEKPSTTGLRSSENAQNLWSQITSQVRLIGHTRDAKLEQIQDALMWFARDALIHLSTPRGLEQASGGGWGVRDVCQGPVEFLLSYGHADIVADILRKLFAQQLAHGGDWPQWFMFPPFQEIRARDSHGDVLIWPLKALCDYLEHTNDGSILESRVPYSDDESLRGTDHAETILEHGDRAFKRMREQLLSGLALPRYGEGDWDDSLQLADPALRQRTASSWTAALMYQTLRRWSTAMSHFGHAQRAAQADALADAIHTDFQRYLIRDDVVAGFAVFDGQPPRPVEYLLHPTDARTKIRYRLIPMTRGILSGIFSPPQAKHHLNLVREHLLFPDGARLMDRPTKYEGGKEHTFRRAESAAFFGREIGLQYVHAHLRYAEALAMMGHPDELWRALRVVNPIAVTEVVPNARARQRNCYFSSSDAAFADRYQASRDYDKLRCGQVPTDGGWRIYSSGPGIYTSLVIRHLFGLRRYFDWIELDPVLPRDLDGATCELIQNGRRVRYQFWVRDGNWGPKRISVNGVQLPMATQVTNPYRDGAVRVRRSDFEQAIGSQENAVQIDL